MGWSAKTYAFAPHHCSIHSLVKIIMQQLLGLPFQLILHVVNMVIQCRKLYALFLATIGCIVFIYVNCRFWLLWKKPLL